MKKKPIHSRPRRVAVSLKDSACLSSGYQPLKAEVDEDMRIDTTPEELAQAVMGRHPRRISDSRPS